jgi:hypothetical protein
MLQDPLPGAPAIFSMDPQSFHDDFANASSSITNLSRWVSAVSEPGFGTPFTREQRADLASVTTDLIKQLHLAGATTIPFDHWDQPRGPEDLFQAVIRLRSSHKPAARALPARASQPHPDPSATPRGSARPPLPPVKDVWESFLAVATRSAAAAKRKFAKGTPVPLHPSQPPLVDHSKRPRLGAPKTFAQAASTPASRTPLAVVAKAFPNATITNLSRLMSTAPTAPRKPPTAKAVATTKGPSRRRLLITAERQDPGQPRTPCSFPKEVVYQRILAHFRSSTNAIEQGLPIAAGLALVFKSVPSDEDARQALRHAQDSCPANIVAKMDRPMSRSSLLLTDLPAAVQGVETTPDRVTAWLQASPLAPHLTLASTPRVKKFANAHTCVAYIDIWDSQAGTHAKYVVGKSILTHGYVSRFRVVKARVFSPLCTRCWKWGHTAARCSSPTPKCELCDGPHQAIHHRTLARCCRGLPKATPPVPPTPEGNPCPHPPSCINCQKDHPSNSSKCVFWKRRTDPDWIANASKVSPRRGSPQRKTNPPVDP